MRQPLPFLSDEPVKGHREMLRSSRRALAGMDDWVRDAERVLVGREIVVTHSSSALRGKIKRVTSVVVTAAASGMHLFLVVEGDLFFYELGFTCELLEETDIPNPEGV